MADESDDFLALLKETGVLLTPPENFVACVSQPNSIFAYQHAHRSPSGDLELRYRIDSIRRLQEERRIANEGVDVLASTDLNKLHEYAFLAMLFNLHGGQISPTTIFTPEGAAEMFGADWAAMCFLSLASNDFAPGYNTAGAFCIHKDDVADVYLIAVFNDRFEEGGNVARLFDEPPGLRFV